MSLTKLTCRKGCGKGYKSLYHSEAVSNMSMHEQFCKGPGNRAKKTVKRVCKCGKELIGYSKKQTDWCLKKHQGSCKVKK